MHVISMDKETITCGTVNLEKTKLLHMHCLFVQILLVICLSELDGCKIIPPSKANISEVFRYGIRLIAQKYCIEKSMISQCPVHQR